jgi:DNA polymerase-3 subunit delta'
MKALVEASYLHQRDAMLELLLAWMGDVVRHKVGAESFDLPEYLEATRAIAERSTIQEATQRLRTLNKLERHLHTNVNEALALEVCFTQAFG